ncbi:hypothetical protein DF186_25790, partial [Enterococcus hirae]
VVGHRAIAPAVLGGVERAVGALHQQWRRHAARDRAETGAEGHPPHAGEALPGHCRAEVVQAPLHGLGGFAAEHQRE